MATVTLEDIRAARERIRERVPETPLIRAHGLSDRLGVPIDLKCELMQKTGSFKPRGAFNWMRTADPDQLARGLITISAGNHAMALAWAASELGVPVTVVMPEGSSPMKVAATRAYGAEVVLHGDINAAMERMEALQRERGLVLVHPFNDPRIVAGQGTVGLEILEQCPDAGQVLVPVGGGGLISGIGIAVKSRRPEVRVIGIEPEGAATLHAAWQHDGPFRLDRVETVAASLGASLAGDVTYALSRRYVDDIVLLSEDEIRTGIRETFATCKLFAEPGGTLAVAALALGRVEPAPGPTVAVITGGNVDLEAVPALL